MQLHTSNAVLASSLSLSLRSPINPSGHIIINDPCKVIEMCVMRLDTQMYPDKHTHTFSLSLIMKP